MPKVSKKRQFCGQNRWNVDTSNSDNNLSSPRVSTPVLETASVRKVRVRVMREANVLVKHTAID